MDWWTTGLMGRVSRLRGRSFIRGPPVIGKPHPHATLTDRPAPRIRNASMKNRLAFLPALIFALVAGLLAGTRAHGQASHTVDSSVTSTPISAGKIVGVSSKDGSWSCRSVPRGASSPFPAWTACRLPGLRSACGAVRGGRGDVRDRVLREAERPLVYRAGGHPRSGESETAGLSRSRAQRRAAASRASNDNDITTNAR